MNEGFGSGKCQGGTEAGNVPEMKKGCFGYVFNVREKRQGGVKDYTKVADVGGGFNEGAVDVE